MDEQNEEMDLDTEYEDMDPDAEFTVGQRIVVGIGIGLVAVGMLLGIATAILFNVKGVERFARKCSTSRRKWSLICSTSAMNLINSMSAFLGRRSKICFSLRKRRTPPKSVG